VFLKKTKARSNGPWPTHVVKGGNVTSKGLLEQQKYSFSDGGVWKAGGRGRKGHTVKLTEFSARR